jgi:hypothetical protein
MIRHNIALAVGLGKASPLKRLLSEFSSEIFHLKNMDHLQKS